MVYRFIYTHHDLISDLDLFRIPKAILSATKQL